MTHWLWLEENDGSDPRRVPCDCIFGEDHTRQAEERWTEDETQSLVRGVRKLFVDRAIPVLEEALEASGDHSWPPAPNTAHPYFDHAAPFVRRLMDEGKHVVLLPGPIKPLYHYLIDLEPDPTSIQDTRVVLDVRRVSEPAPYVGDPFDYRWRVAVDRHGRWVAGDSWPQYRPVSDRMETP